MEVLEEKVSQLEEMMMRLLYIQQKTEMEIQSLSREMKEYKQQVDKQINEYKQENDRRFAKMDEEFEKYKQENDRRFAKMDEEFEKYKKQVNEQIREMNKKWGEISNKLGTIVEDIIFPASKPVLEKYFNCEITDIHMNRKRKKDNLKDEFDVIAVSDPCKTVYLIEVKATPKIDYINEFKDEKLERFKALFPEYKDYKLVPIFASLRLEDDIVNYLTKNKIYAMAYREWEYMDILNFDEV
jgi:DNA-binding transcriptional MerR regulator